MSTATLPPCWGGVRLSFNFPADNRGRDDVVNILRYRLAPTVTGGAGLLISLLIAGPAAGQAGVPIFALPTDSAGRAFVTEVLRRNAGLSAEWGRVAAAGRRIGPAGALPDPVLRGGVLSLPNPSFDFAAEAMTQVPVGIEQRIPGFGKRGARTEVALADSASRSAGALTMVAALAAEAAARFVHLAERRDAHPIHEARLALASAAVSAAQSRYAAGSAPQTDPIRARVRRVQLEEERDALVAEVAGALASANALRGTGDTLATPGTVIATTEAFFSWELPPAGLVPTLLAEGNPELRASRAGVERAERISAVFRLDARPDFTVSLQEGIRFGGREPMLTALVGVSIPFWQGRKQGPLADAAHLEVIAARDLQRDLAARIEGEVRTLVARLEALQLRITRVKEELLPLARAASASALQQYRTGGTDITAVLAAQDDAWRAELRLNGLVADYFAGRARLASLLGEEWYQ